MLGLFALESVFPQHPGVNRHSVFIGKEGLHGMNGSEAGKL